MSTHKVEIIRVKEILPHPNADRLEMIPVFDYNCIVGKGQFMKGDLAVFIEPDYVVPDRPEYAFLEGHFRIKSKRLRKVWSQGLLMPLSSVGLDGGKVAEGDDVMGELGITRYEPPMKGQPTLPGAKTGKGYGSEKPHVSFYGVPTYDLENFRRNLEVFDPEETVVITEKIHGCNARYAFRDGRMYVGSRTQWRKPPGIFTWWEKALGFFGIKLKETRQKEHRITNPNTWWAALKANPWIEEFCRANPDTILYGEVFGDVQDLKYGAKEGQVFFRAFDVYDTAAHKFWDAGEFISRFGWFQRTPVLYVGALKDLLDTLGLSLHALSMTDSELCAGQMSEGLVIKPWVERRDHRVGRVALKYVSDRYLERN